MTPLYLEIHGSLGIKAGLGHEVLRLNLSEHVPDDATIVAICGDNGSGKSTLMNLGLVPWREVPTIAGDLYANFGPKGARILLWQHGATKYRSEIQITQTAKTKGQKAFLYEVDDKNGELTTVSFPDGLVSDGKVRTYDQALERILGPQSLYYLSAFRGQGADKLAEYSDPKQLMRDLLGLDQVEEKIGRVKLVVREIKRELSAWQDKVMSARAAREDIVSLGLRANEETAQLEAARAEMDSAASAVTLAQHNLKEAEAGAADVLRARKEYAWAKATLTGCQQRLSSRRSEKDREITKAKRAAEETAANYLRSLRQAEERALALETRIRDATKMIELAGQVAESREALDRMERDLVAVQAERDALMERHRVLDGICVEIAEKRAAIDRLVAEGKSLADQVESLTRLSWFVDEVPCRGQGEYAACPCLREAIEAADKVVPLVALKSAKVQEWGALSKEMKSINERETTAGPRDKNGIVTADQKIEKLRREMAQHREMVAKEAQIASAQAVIAEAERDLQDARARAEESAETIRSYREGVTVSLAELETGFAADIATLEAEVTEAEAVLAATAKPEETNQIAAAIEALKIARANHSFAENLADQRAGILSAIRAEIASKEETVRRSADAERYANHVADELALYNLLASALRGVIDLTIEDAGPAIAATANDLLEASYGPRFTLAITTQRTNAQGDLVETFDVEVYDADSGQRSSIVHKSGGESVWLDKALTDAVGLYHQSVSGHGYETLFGDEVEDGLTSERKTMYYRMQRSTMERGGYRRLYFVSHNPEAWASADAVIEMENLR